MTDQPAKTRMAGFTKFTVEEAREYLEEARVEHNTRDHTGIFAVAHSLLEEVDRLRAANRNKPA